MIYLNIQNKALKKECFIFDDLTLKPNPTSRPLFEVVFFGQCIKPSIDINSSKLVWAYTNNLAWAMSSHQNIRLQVGECLLLCSDGFSDVLEGNFLPITKDLPLNEWLNDSIKQLKQSGSKAQLDNVSLIVVRCMA